MLDAKLNSQLASIPNKIKKMKVDDFINKYKENENNVLKESNLRSKKKLNDLIELVTSTKYRSALR